MNLFNRTTEHSTIENSPAHIAFGDGGGGYDWYTLISAGFIRRELIDGVNDEGFVQIWTGITEHRHVIACSSLDVSTLSQAFLGFVSRGAVPPLEYSCEVYPDAIIGDRYDGRAKRADIMLFLRTLTSPEK